MAKRSRIKIDFNFSSGELRGGRRDSKRRRSCVLSRPGQAEMGTAGPGAGTVFTVSPCLELEVRG